MEASTPHMHNVQIHEAAMYTAGDATKSQDKLRAQHTEKKQAAHNEISKYSARKLAAPLTRGTRIYKN
jgi:hypothetical protein